MTAESAGVLRLPGLTGRTVVVTGALGGQGVAECLVLLASGGVVIATDLADEPSARLEDEAAGLPGELHYRRLDTGSVEQWANLASWLDERGQGVQGLVNNAGIPFRARLGQIDLADWERVLRVNLTGPMLGIQAMAPLMGRGGSIVNIGSVAALTGHHTVAYTASKWGLRGVTHVAATELGARGIRTNIVHPGYIDTPMMASAPAVMAETQVLLTPLERVGQPEEVAAVVAFLVSDHSAFINGAEIPVDGGFASAGGIKFLSDALARSDPRMGTQNYR